MPPLVLEIGVVLGLITATIKLTTSINRIESTQRVFYSEMSGKLEVLAQRLTHIDRETSEFKAEIKDLRRRRHNDPDTGFN